MDAKTSIEIARIGTLAARELKSKGRLNLEGVTDALVKGFQAIYHLAETHYDAQFAAYRQRIEEERADERKAFEEQLLANQAEVERLQTTIGKYEDVMVAMNEQIEEERARRAEAEEASTIDSLTGLLNQRGYNIAIKREIGRAEREEKPLTMIMIDIDYFKSVNDGYGHMAGDAYLKLISYAINQNIRTTDIAVRKGGEEFCLILPNTDEEGGIILADKIRQYFDALTSNHPLVRSVLQNDYGYSAEGKGDNHMPKKIPEKVTVSCGVAQYNSDMGSLDELYAKADSRLYEAKHTGRNKVVPKGIGQVFLEETGKAPELNTDSKV